MTARDLLNALQTMSPSELDSAEIWIRDYDGMEGDPSRVIVDSGRVTLACE